MRGDICAICCGSEREQTIHCPLDCEYLQESRRHEKTPEVDPDTFPNKDIRVTEDFLRDHEPLLMFVAASLLEAALQTPDAVDADVRDALDSLVRTYRTLQSGLYYEARPSNPIAGAIFARMQERIEEYRKQAAQTTGMQVLRDADVLGVYAFLQRMAIQQDNGRRLGRAFIDFLRMHFPQAAAPEPSRSVIL